MPNPPSTAQSNTTSMSQKIDTKRVLTFQELWDNYPEEFPCIKPKTNSKWYENEEPTYSNQCAIRVSVSLHKSGVSFKTFKGAVCNYVHNVHVSEKHVIRAQELANWLDKRYLANWLDKRYLANWPKSDQITGKDWVEKIAGKTGVIFFQDYWQRAGEKYPTGDHIDLWNGSRFPHHSINALAINLSRFSIGVDSLSSPFSQDNWYSDLGNATKILFWQIQ